MKKINTILIGICTISVAATAAPFGVEPDWESNDIGSSQKTLLADFNGDGWQTEIGEQNTGDGTAKCFYLEHYPAREITEIRVNGAPLTLADYCCDPYNGWFSLAAAPGNGIIVEVDYVWSNRLDLFVSNMYLVAVGGRDVIYFNTGSELNVDAGWQSDLDDDSMYCVAADIDLDGDIDLISDGGAQGDDHIYVFYNDGNGLETTPSWECANVAISCFSLGDMDKDGYPELAVANWYGFNFCVFDNVNGTLNSTPVWSVNDPNPKSVAWGDYDCDGDLDLAGGTYGGYTRVFRNSAGVLDITSCWQNDPPPGRCEALAWGDINGDGLLDLYKGICGRGTNDDPYADIFFNTGAGLPTSPSWESTLYTHVSTTSIADYDGDGLRDIVNTTAHAIGYFHKYTGILEEYPSWDYDPGNPYWIDGSATGDINNDGLFDIAVACHKYTGYPDGGPNKVFYNNGTGVGIDDKTPNTPAGFALYQSYPNPMRDSAIITFALPHTAHVNLEVFDVKGRKVSTLINETLIEGEHERTVSGLAAGLYLYRLTAGENSAVRKMVVK